MRIFLFCFLFVAAGTWAQTPWSLDDCIRYGVEQNLTLHNKQLDTRIAGENYLGALGRFLPEVGTSGNLGKRFGRSVDPKTNLYTETAFVESNLGLNVSLPLFEGFTRINYLKFQKLNRAISRLDAQVKENDVAYEVMDAYYQYCFERRMLELAGEQRRLSEEYLARTEEYLALGLRSPSDLQEMKARLQSDIYQETVRENNLRSALLRLKKLLNLTERDSLRIACTENDSLPLLYQPAMAEEIYRISETVLPQMRAMELRQQAARRSVALAAGKFWPIIQGKFSWQTGYYDTERNEAGGLISFADQLRNNESKYIGISISFPILTSLSRLTEVRKERLRLKQVRNDVAQQKISLYAEIEEACQELKAAATEHAEALERLRFETISLEENEEKWAEGLISIFELTEKRNQYISAKAELARCLLQYEIKDRTLEFYRRGTFIHAQ